VPRHRRSVGVVQAAAGELSVFRLLGILLALYVVRCLSTGEVFAKSGPWGKTCRREEDTFEYWGAIVVYVGIVLALFFWF